MIPLAVSMNRIFAVLLDIIHFNCVLYNMMACYCYSIIGRKVNRAKEICVTEVPVVDRYR